MAQLRKAGARVTPSELQRAATVLFAAREAGPDAGSEAMKLIACVIRNRVKSGWGDGTWLSVVESAAEVSAHDPLPFHALDLNRRPLQVLARDIDEIFYSEPVDFAKHPGDVPWDVTHAAGKALYWLVLNRELRPWFRTNIVQDTKNHPSRTTAGLIMLFD